MYQIGGPRLKTGISEVPYYGKFRSNTGSGTVVDDEDTLIVR